MLKLEKESKSKTIHVSFRQSDSVGNQLFRKALLCAILLHLVGIWIFHIQPYHLKWIPPSKSLHIDLDFDRPLELVVDAQNTQLIADEMDAPPLFENFLSEIKQDKFDIAETVVKALDESSSQLELPFQHMQSIYPNFYQPLQIYITGDLANRILHSPNDLNRKVTRDQDIHYLSLLYRVRVDEETGKVFWFELLNKQPSKKLRIRSEEILKELSFSKSPDNIEVEGQVEIIFALPVSEKE